jgi:tripartite-type tricarboxylate transporter receptor subunit TctC
VILRRVVVLILAMMVALAGPAYAWPDKQIVLVVPFAAGGTNDTLSRVLSEQLSKALGQVVVVENDPGAAGTTPAARVARAKPDGYTLLMGNMGTHGIAPSQYPNLKYDPVRDFTPIGLSGEVPAVLVVRKDFPAQNLREFIDYVRKNQDKVNEAHAGVGSPTHSFCTLLQSLMGTNTARVAYRGGAQAMNDLIAGQVDFSCISLSGAISQIQGGMIRAIALASPARFDVVKDVPTAREGGLPEFEVSTWNALFAPKGLPADIQARLAEALDRALDEPAVRKRLDELGIVIPEKARRGPEPLQNVVAFEVQRWAKVLAPPAGK